MKTYLAVLLSVAAIALGIYFPPRPKPQTRSRPNTQLATIPAKPGDLSWLNLYGALSKALKGGKLVRSSNVDVMLESSKSESFLARNVMILGVDTSEIDTVLGWLSARPESQLAQPFRVRFCERKPESSPGTVVIDTLRTLVFENGKFAEKPRYDDTPLQSAPPESLWPTLKEKFRNAVASGELLSKKPSRIIEDVGTEIGKTKRNIMIVDVEPEDVTKVLKWFHANRASRLIEPFRLRFFTSVESTSAQPRKLLKPSWTVEFDCGLYGRVSDGSGEEAIEIPQ